MNNHAADQQKDKVSIVQAKSMLQKAGVRTLHRHNSNLFFFTFKLNSLFVFAVNKGNSNV